MAENPSSKSSKVQATDVNIVGTAGTTALNVSTGNVAITDNVSITGNTTFGGQMTGYHRLATGDIRGLTVVEKTDNDTDTGFTMEVNKLTNSLYDGGGAAANMVVPALAAGEVAVFRFCAGA